MKNMIKIIKSINLAKLEKIDGNKLGGDTID